MKHIPSSKFWDYFDALPEPIQKLAREKFSLLKNNPRHPSLDFKPLKGDVWRVCVGLHYRAYAAREKDAFVWFWIGTHEEYNHRIKRLH